MTSNILGFNRYLLLVLMLNLVNSKDSYGRPRSNFDESEEHLEKNRIPDVCSSNLQLRISTEEYDYIIKGFQRAELRERSNKKQRKRQKSLKEQNASLPGFITEETTRRILSDVFQKRGFSDKTISEFLVTRKNNENSKGETTGDDNEIEIQPERPGCRCVDSFFLDLSPPRLPRRHRLPHAGFIPDIYNLADVCDIALDLLNSDRAVMQRSRSYPVARELIMGTQNMKHVLHNEDESLGIEGIGEGKDAKEKIEKILEKLAKIIDVMRTRIKSI